jgi:hypothetical protein
MRKTKTSTKVKDRYIKKTYDEFRVYVRKEHAAVFRAELARHGGTISSVLRAAVFKYIDDSKTGNLPVTEMSDDRPGGK